MTPRRIVASALTFLALLAPACSNTPDTGTQTDNHTSTNLDFLPVLEMGASVSGQVASPQLDLWALDLKAGDKVTLLETITSGDLAPDVVLFRGSLGNKISSASFDVADDMLTKSYAVDSGGRYIVMVRGYQNQGAGAYTLTATCDGGPCAGEVVPPQVVELDNEQKHECIRQARVCSVTELPPWNGAVGAVRARQIFDGCLGQATVESWESEIPASCTTACQGEASDLCDGVVELLPWLADQAPACVSEWSSWVDECYDAPWGDPEVDESVFYGGEGICVVGDAAFNGYPKNVEDTEVCGGQWANDSCEACYLQCEATTGAWIDDLDVICEETCGCEPNEDVWN